MLFRISFAFVVFSSLVLGAQELSGVIQQAKNLVTDKNEYASAESLLNQNASSDARAVSEAFTEIGILEYNRRNFRNAYSSFRQAIRLQATNQTANQYFLRMRREMDVNNLKNEYTPPAPQVAVQLPQSVPSVPTNIATPQTENAQSPTQDGNSARVQQQEAQAEQQRLAQERSNAELQAMLAQLKAAEDRLNSTQTSVISTQRENETLRRQLEAQRQMVERLIAQQSARPQTPVVVSNTQNAQLAEAIQLMAQIAQRPVVVETDPTIKELIGELKQVRTTDSSLDLFSPPMLWLTLIIIVTLVAVLLMVSLFVIALVRSRQVKNQTQEYKGSHGIIPVGLDSGTVNLFLPQQNPKTQSDFQTGGAYPMENIENQRLMLRADHLQKMYDDAKSGKLSWDTIRRYIDDLDKSLRNEILKVVELKLETGALLSGEAALPILFPFLTDFDAYLSSKAEELIKKSLSFQRGPKSTNNGDDTFSIASLSVIPKKLTELTKNHDRTLVTAQLSYGIAKNLGLSSSESEDVYRGALAHDAGYLLLDQNKLQRILSKPEITDEEWKFIQSHVENGIEYFHGATLPPSVRDAILYHHERNDGSGYPRGLKKEEIPLTAKIIGVAETFAALITHRSYREKQDVKSALAIIRDGARRKFDAEIVLALEKVVSINGGTL